MQFSNLFSPLPILYPPFIHSLSNLYPTSILIYRAFIQPLNFYLPFMQLVCISRLSPVIQRISSLLFIQALSNPYFYPRFIQFFLSKFYPASIHIFFEPVSLYPPFIQPSITPLSSLYPTSLPTFCPSFLNFFYPLLIHPLNPSQPFTQPLSTLYPCFIQPLANLYPTIQLITFDPLFTNLSPVVPHKAVAEVSKMENL